MALPGFYNEADQAIYESGNKFIPQEQYRLGYPNTPPPSIANPASTGITNTQAASPYIWPPQGGGGDGPGSGNKFGLNMDRMSGASALQNWVEHLILMDRTNLHSMRLLKIVKARGVDFPNDYYGIQWNIDEFKLSMIGVVRDWKRFIIDEHKKKSWQQALNKIAEEFSTKDWVTRVSDELGLVKERQAKE